MSSVETVKKNAFLEVTREFFVQLKSTNDPHEAVFIEMHFKFNLKRLYQQLESILKINLKQFFVRFLLFTVGRGLFI